MRALTLVTRLVAVLALAAMAVPFVWEKVTGDFFMTVTGVSMRPTYDIGDVLVVQEPTGHDLAAVGQPVVVEATPGNDATRYVHRVHEVTSRGAILKGDNNATPDPAPVTEAQVQGTPRTALTGGVAFLFHLSQSWWIRGGAVALLILSMFVSTPKRKAVRRQPEASGVPLAVPEAHG